MNASLQFDAYNQFLAFSFPSPIFLSVIGRFSSTPPYSGLVESQNRVLADLLLRMAPSEAMLSPQWPFERDCPESKLVEDVRAPIGLLFFYVD